MNENAGTPQDVLALEQLAPVKSCGPQTGADTPFLFIVEQAGELEQVTVWWDGGVGILFQFEELSRSPTHCLCHCSLQMWWTTRQCRCT